MKFNFSIRKRKPVTNYEGAKAYVLTPEMELYAAVAATALSDSFYEKADARLERIQKLVSVVDPQFVARLAIYARRQLNLRSIPLVLASELAKIHTGDDVVSRMVAKVVQRPDEITELLAYYQISNGRSGLKKLNRLSRQIQKGLAMSFNRFDEYQFAKYDRPTEVKLRDALFLVHPKAKDEAQQTLFNKIARKELAVPYTWETELSALGQRRFEDDSVKRLAVKAKWEELIDSNKLGYMALLRNLRNIIEADVSPAHVERVGTFLSDKTRVQQSKQLPFRFLAAHRELSSLQSGYVPFLLDALEKAVQYSVDSLSGFGMETRVVVACDVSGSMQKAISAKSKVMLYDVGLVLGMLLQSKCKNVLTGMFGDFWKTIHLPSNQVLANVDAFYKREGEVGYATNGYRVIKDLISRRYKADKVMLFTDMQLWNNSQNQLSEDTISYQWKMYKLIAPDARLYLFDLSGYGTIPFQQKERDVFLIAGWSDKIFNVLEALESGGSALEVVQKIEF